MGQGRENARVFLREHKDIREKLETSLRKKMEIPAPGGESGAVSSGTNGVSHNEKHVATAAAATAAKARPAGARN